MSALLHHAWRQLQKRPSLVLTAAHTALMHPYEPTVSQACTRCTVSESALLQLPLQHARKPQIQLPGTWHVRLCSTTRQCRHHITSHRSMCPAVRSISAAYRPSSQQRALPTTNQRATACSTPLVWHSHCLKSRPTFHHHTPDPRPHADCHHTTTSCSATLTTAGSTATATHPAPHAGLRPCWHTQYSAIATATGPQRPPHHPQPPT